MCQISVKSDNSNEMVKQIKDLNNYFIQLINLIPPKIYYNKNEEILEKIESMKRKKFENSNMSSKSKNKRIKLDPNSQQKVSDIASEYCNTKKSNGKIKDLRKKLAIRIKELRSQREPMNPNQKNKWNQSKESDSKQILNKNGDLVFSKFDLTSQVDLAAEKEITKDKNKKKQSLKGLLAKTKREEEKINKLQQTNSEAALKLKEKKIWKSVLEKSEGNKVRDDPKLIEKTLKRKQKIKQKKGKAWSERQANVTKRRQIKQEKRQRNLDERRQKRRDKKMKRMKKKGHILD